MNYFLVIISFLLVSVNLTGQNNWNTFPKLQKDTLQHAEKDSMVMVRPPADTPTACVKPIIHIPDSIALINSELQKHNEQNLLIKGYTILLYSGSGANSKQLARNTELKFLEDFPELKTHLAWKNPNYEVRVGDFRTKLEAEKALQKILEKFPAAFVRSDMVEFPPLEKETTP